MLVSSIILEAANLAEPKAKAISITSRNNHAEVKVKVVPRSKLCLALALRVSGLMELEAEIDRLPIDLLAHIFVLFTSFTDLAQ